MVRDSRGGRDGSFVGEGGGYSSGWKNDIPLHVYEHITRTFLHVMQNQIAAISDFNYEAFKGDSG
jgi:hypothetical protein